MSYTREGDVYVWGDGKGINVTVNAYRIPEDGYTLLRDADKRLNTDDTSALDWATGLRAVYDTFPKVPHPTAGKSFYFRDGTNKEQRADAAAVLTVWWMEGLDVPAYCIERLRQEAVGN